jgi:hypothetical protein
MRIFRNSCSAGDYSTECADGNIRSRSYLGSFSCRGATSV